MPETIKTQSALLSEMADGGNNTAEEVRNGIVSMWTPGWVRYLDHRLPSETAHTDDDFFASDSSADYTEHTVSGTATWDIDLGTLGAVVAGQTSDDMSAFVKPITSAVAPMTIEARISGFVQYDDFPKGAICFTDGVVDSSNVISAGIVGNDGAPSVGSALAFQAGTLTDHNVTFDSVVITTMGHGFIAAYFRLIWVSANTFNVAFSLDGHTWRNAGESDGSKTMTPTHIGFLASNNGSGIEQSYAWDYLRVYDADLSP